VRTLDPTLTDIVERLSERLDAAGLTRLRGGFSNGVHWAERSGRSPDGSWLELRLHHWTDRRTVSAGLVEYQPLSRGGRTEERGQHSVAYKDSDSETLALVVVALEPVIAEWLAR